MFNRQEYVADGGMVIVDVPVNAVVMFTDTGDVPGFVRVIEPGSEGDFTAMTRASLSSTLMKTFSTSATEWLASALKQADAEPPEIVVGTVNTGAPPGHDMSETRHVSAPPKLDRSM